MYLGSSLRFISGKICVHEKKSSILIPELKRGGGGGLPVPNIPTLDLYPG